MSCKQNNLKDIEEQDLINCEQSFCNAESQPGPSGINTGMTDKRITKPTHWRYSYHEVPKYDDNTLLRKKILVNSSYQSRSSNDVWLSSRETQAEFPPISDVLASSLANSIHKQAETELLETKHKEKYWFQFLVAISATLSLFACGTNFGWVGPTINELLVQNSTIPITSSESAWLASMLPLGGCLGPVIGSISADYLGRKISILLTAIPYLLTWMIIGMATNVYFLYSAQFIAGIAAGASFTVTPMYVGEIASAKIRGTLSNFISVQFNLGILMEYILVPHIPIKINAILMSVIPILLLITFIWMPESPYYYIMDDKELEAELALKTLRQSDDVTKELEHMKTAIYKEREEKGTVLDLFKVPSNRFALFILFVIITVQDFSGLTPVISYAQVIFSKASSPISTNLSGIILAATTFFIVIICSILVDTWGRRPLLLISSMSTTIPLAAIGTFFYLQEMNYEFVDSITLIPIIALIVYKLTFGLGIGPLPYVCLCELFPTGVKALATCLVSTYGSLTGFIITKIYQIIADNFGTYVIFYFFATVSIFGAIFIYFTVPETKGRTLEEIQEDLKGTKETASSIRV